MTGSLARGYICCVVAGVAFGSNYLPVKQVEVRDGIFFSACMSIGIMLVGLVVNFTLADEDYGILPPHRPPKFEVLAAVGGGIWMLGNLFCPLIVRLLGLGLGLAIWDCFNLLTGWLTGNLGLFGVWKESVASPVLNYAGVVLALLSLVVLSFAADGGEEPAKEADSEGSASAGASPAESEASEVPDLEQPEVPDLEQPSDATEEPPREPGESPAAERPEAANEAAEPQQPGAPRVIGRPSWPAADGGLAKRTSTASSGLRRVGTTSTVCSSADGTMSTVCSSADASLAGDEESHSELDEGRRAPSGIWAGSISEGGASRWGSESAAPASDASSASPLSLTTAQVQAAAMRVGGGAAASQTPAAAAQQGQVVGFFLAMLTGVLFGLTFDLPTDLMQLGKLGGGHSTDPMDYVFSHFCGIGITSAAALLVYGAVRREESYMPRSAVLPAIASGVMWGVGQVVWFQANLDLSMVVAFPVISTLPGIVGMCWGYFLFGEFRSARSRRLAAAGMALRIPAVTLIALSAMVSL